MTHYDKIHINSFKFYDRDELEELTTQYYLENKRLKEQLQQKEDIINKVKDYINNNPLYDIDGYENNTYLSGIDDKQTRKELLQILDNKGE